jgi:hypothetical protein
MAPLSRGLAIEVGHPGWHFLPVPGVTRRAMGNHTPVVVNHESIHSD